MMNYKDKYTLSPPVGAVSNRTGLECFINFKVHHKSDCEELTILYR